MNTMHLLIETFKGKYVEFIRNPIFSYAITEAKFPIIILYNGILLQEIVFLKEDLQ